ncbi:MAG: hypothetical protein RNU03_04220 [Candidatus Sedimenticola sp. (ex Thyasira tokunagai)]
MSTVEQKITGLTAILFLLLLLTGKVTAAESSLYKLSSLWHAPQGIALSKEAAAWIRQLPQQEGTGSVSCTPSSLPKLAPDKPTSLFKLTSQQLTNENIVVHTKDTITERFIVVYWSVDGCMHIHESGRAIKPDSRQQLLSPFPYVQTHKLSPDRPILILIQDSKSIRPWIQAGTFQQFLQQNTHAWITLGGYTGILLILLLIGIGFVIWQKSALSIAYVIYILALQFWHKRVFDFVMQNGTSESPFCTQSSTAYYCPGRPGLQHYAITSQARYCFVADSRDDLTSRSYAIFGFPLALCARRASSIASRLPGTNRLGFQPSLAVSDCRRWVSGQH